MKLLLITQVVDENDSNLGFFCRWIEEFAAHCERVTVICLKEGDHFLPPHVKVLSLGKEEGTSFFTKVRRFYRYIRDYRSAYDAVFVHMNPEYVLLGGWLWRRWGKKISLWYAHGSVTWKLRKAVEMLDIVFTVSPTSFRVATPKLRPVGHGIDTDRFVPGMREYSVDTKIITAGRIAGSKHVLEMLSVLDILDAHGKKFTFTIVGAPVSSAEEVYAQKLADEIAKRSYRHKIHMAGALSHHQLPELLNKSDVALNFATTGNMDKAGLEALSAGVPLLSTNKAFEGLLSPYGLYVPTMHPEAVADALEKFLKRGDSAAIISQLRHKVIDEHSLSKLIPKIINSLAHES